MGLGDSTVSRRGIGVLREAPEGAPVRCSRESVLVYFTLVNRLRRSVIVGE